jgi:hypothetical protein
VSPDGSGDHKIKALVEYVQIEVRVVVKPGILVHSKVGFQQDPDTGFQHPPTRFDPELATPVQEVDKPIATPQATASYVQDSRVRRESSVQERDEQLSTAASKSSSDPPRQIPSPTRSLTRSVKVFIRTSTSLPRVSAGPPDRRVARLWAKMGLVTWAVG